MAQGDDTYPDGFAWDEAKRRSNLAKHGIDFIDAGCVFKGRCYQDVGAPTGAISVIGT